MGKNAERDRPELKAKVAELLLPYLQAFQDGDHTGDDFFDREVTNNHTLSVFLADKVVSSIFAD